MPRIFRGLIHFLDLDWMSNRLSNPDIAYFTSSGAALSGYQLGFFASGTSTPLATYSNQALTIPNPNPIVLDSNGRAGAVFLSNLAYKVSLALPNDTFPPASPIWTQDPVYTSDYSAVAQVQSVNGNPNGQLAGTQGTVTIPASMAWDYADQILYVCTLTGNAAGAVWTAVNPNTTSSVLPSPQGRLTLASNTAVLSTDTIAATTVYYTPYTGILVPIYNGTTFIPTSIVSQLSIGLVAAHAANNIYDFFIFSLSGTPTLGTGPSWSAGTSGSITAGSCARGTGSGGAALSMLSGINTNAVSMTMTYGPSGATTAVAANKGTYVGTMFMDATNGQVTCHLSYGQNRKYGLWNAYNRVPVVLQVGDATSSWTYATATIRASNGTPASYSGASFNVGSGTTCNGMTVLCGLAEELINCSFLQKSNGSAGNISWSEGIGFNSTTAYSGTAGFISTATTGVMTVANFIAAPAPGINVVAALEEGAGSGTQTFYGTQTNMLLQAQWRG
jgi:hypothetical protein